jgi:hypothetical protein
VRSRHRDFQLLDAMILIAATAVGFAVTKLYDERTGYHLISPAPDDHNELDVSTYLSWGLRLMTPTVGMWTLAFAVLRLRYPRPRFRRLFRQPGMAGCATVLIVPPVFVGWKILGMMLRAEGEFVGQGIGYWLPGTCEESLFWVGSSVVAVWVNLALSRRCVSEPSWIDRMGRMLACFWIIAPILAVIDWT